MLRPIFYDTETTGFKSEIDYIIEIAAYDPIKNNTFESLINPGRPIPPEVTAVHKITDEMVADAPNFSQVGRDFVQFCEGDVVLIAHNNDSFDKHFLKSEFARNNLEMPDWKFLDTLKWARKYRPDLPKHSLQFLREIYGIPANNAHRALDDVIVLHEVFCLLTDDLPLDTAYELMQKPQVIQRMPFGKYQGSLLKDLPISYLDWLKQNGVFEKPENDDLKNSFLLLGLLN